MLQEQVCSNKCKYVLQQEWQGETLQFVSGQCYKASYKCCIFILYPFKNWLSNAHHLCLHKEFSKPNRRFRFNLVLVSKKSQLQLIHDIGGHYNVWHYNIQDDMAGDPSGKRQQALNDTMSTSTNFTKEMNQGVQKVEERNSSLKQGLQVSTICIRVLELLVLLLVCWNSFLKPKICKQRGLQHCAKEYDGTIDFLNTNRYIKMQWWYVNEHPCFIVGWLMDGQKEEKFCKTTTLGVGIHSVKRLHLQTTTQVQMGRETLLIQLMPMPNSSDMSKLKKSALIPQNSNIVPSQSF